MGDADVVPQGRFVGVTVTIDVDAADELHQLAGLGTLMRPFGVYRLSDQVDSRRIIPNLRCMKMPHLTLTDTNFPAS
jgi:hypothetical protein